MTRYLYFAVGLVLIVAALPLRAADRPHAGTGSRNTTVWTNEDLERLHSLGLISIVGRIDEVNSTPPHATGPYERTEDPEWYAGRAEELREELESRQSQLREYKQAIEDARSLRKTTAGVNLYESDIALAPEAGIEILESHVSEVQAEINALEDLARRHDIPAGTLRGQ